MPRRLISLVPGETYHVYNRGVDRQPLFFERENYLFFLRRVRKYLLGQTSEVLETSEVFPVTILAYCLMPNHYHLLLTPHDEALSRRMQRLGISYTKAVNKGHARVGPLFQGAFQAIRIKEEGHLVHLTRYLHLNPVLGGLVERPEDWEFSSYREYVGLRGGTLPTPESVLEQFGTVEAYRAFVEEYVRGDEGKIGKVLLE